MLRVSRQMPVSRFIPVPVRTTLPISYCRSALFSSTSSIYAYSDSIPNLKIGAHTRVIFQGFTGRQVYTIVVPSEVIARLRGLCRQHKMRSNLSSMAPRSLAVYDLGKMANILDYPSYQICVPCVLLLLHARLRLDSDRSQFSYRLKSS